MAFNLVSNNAEFFTKQICQPVLGHPVHRICLLYRVGHGFLNTLQAYNELISRAILIKFSAVIVNSQT